jgi:predicted Zn-dependent protease
MNSTIIKRISLFFLLSFILSGLLGCSKVPVTNRKQVSLVSESELIKLSLTSYNEFLEENPPAAESNPDTRMVKQLGSKISTAVEEFLRQHKMGNRVADYKWEFNLVESEQMNAWAMPGGKVVVYSGLLPVTKDEPGLAFVMGHEIAHAVARHGNERMSQALLAQTGAVALDVALHDQPSETKALFMTAYGVGAQVGAILPFSRLHESEADKLGMIFMAMAGYDPHEAPKVWQRMIELNAGPKPPEIMSTHPADDKRIRDLKDYVPHAMKYYNPG